MGFERPTPDLAAAKVRFVAYKTCHVAVERRVARRFGTLVTLSTHLGNRLSAKPASRPAKTSSCPRLSRFCLTLALMILPAFRWGPLRNRKFFKASNREHG